MTEHMLRLTLSESITLKKILTRYVDLLNNDESFQRQFTLPEIFEIRQVYTKLVYRTSNVKEETKGTNENGQKEKDL